MTYIAPKHWLSHNEWNTQVLQGALVFLQDRKQWQKERKKTKKTPVKILLDPLPLESWILQFKATQEQRLSPIASDR